MPRAPKTAKPAQTVADRLTGLPLLPDLLIEGGLRTLAVRVREGSQTVQPLIALWIDRDTSILRATTDLLSPSQHSDGGIGAAMDALVRACTGPFPGAPSEDRLIALPGVAEPVTLTAPRPGLPTTLLVEDAGLADAARQLLEPLGVRVEQGGDLQAFEEAFADMASALGADPSGNVPGPFDWQVDGALLQPLYTEAASYSRRAPWTYMPDFPPVALTLGDLGPEPGVETLYASILGGGGEVLGVALYYTAAGLRAHVEQGTAMVDDDPRIDDLLATLSQAGMPVDMVPPKMARDLIRASGLLQGPGGEAASQPSMVDALLVSFESQKNSDPSYIRWLTDRKIAFTKSKVPTFFRMLEVGDQRPPTEQETRALLAALCTLNAYFSAEGPFLREQLYHLVAGRPMQIGLRVEGEQRTVTAVWPAPGFEAAMLALEAEVIDTNRVLAPASPAAATTLYRFKVALDWNKTTWRRIEMRGDQTLDDLYGAIQRAFDWDNDHLYAFFLSGKAWDQSSEYQSPYGEEGRSAAAYRLEGLPLRPKQKIMYVFDFGDDLRHVVTLEAIVPGGVEAGASYPRITEQHGPNEPQYPALEGEE